MESFEPKWADIGGGKPQKLLDPISELYEMIDWMCLDLALFY
jgi:hypothetical protein